MTTRKRTYMMSDHFRAVGTHFDCDACGQHFEARLGGGARVEVGKLCEPCRRRWHGDRKWRNKLKAQIKTPLPTAIGRGANLQQTIIGNKRHGEYNP